MQITKRLLLMALVLLTTFSANADLGGVYYNDYNYQAVVHDDNTWDVTETITVEFQEPRHGIFRNIPYHWSLPQIDEAGDTLIYNYDNEVTILGVDGYRYSTSDAYNNIVIQIGDEDHTVSGTQTYVIRYKIRYFWDRIAGKDFLYHTILSTDHKEAVHHFSYNIRFDSPLPQESIDKIVVTSGAYGEENKDIQDIKATATCISGELYDIPANYGFTIHTELPENYYANVERPNPTPCYIFYGLAILCALIVIVIAVTAKRPHVTKQIEFYPPEGISSAEVGTIVDDSVDPIDVASLIPWFAHKGYISIKEDKKESLFGSKSTLTIAKEKDIPKDVPYYQWRLMSILFKSGNEVQLDNLKESPEEMKEVFNGVSYSFTGEKKLIRWKWSGWLILVAILLANIALALSSPLRPQSVDFFGMQFTMVVMSILGPFVTIMALKYWQSKRVHMLAKWKNYGINTLTVVITMFSFLVWVSLIAEAGDFVSDAMAAFLFLALLGATLATPYFNIDSPYRVEMLGKLLGLKEFIETAEKPRLESLMQDDPQYFYRILPYALVFGVSDKWAKQFSDITMEKPTWYASDNYTLFSTCAFCDTLCSSSTSAIQVVSHDSSNSSSSSYSGGFAGGGGGGGGFGSW